MNRDDALAAMTGEFQQRAWTMRSDEGTCWKSLYSPPSWRDPVPRFYWTVDGETFRVRHREVVYYLQYGAVPHRLFARCGNPRCVNPGHMAPKWSGRVTPPGAAHSALLEHPVLSQGQIFTPADRDECMAAGHEWRWRKNGLRILHDCICCGARYVEEIEYEGE